ncbi:MAG: hypothetical protein Q7S03_01250 [bacterium]|nr:hypothetical protein [bacterium]
MKIQSMEIIYIMTGIVISVSTPPTAKTALIYLIRTKTKIVLTKLMGLPANFVMKIMILLGATTLRLLIIVQSAETLNFALIAITATIALAAPDFHISSIVF